VAASDIPEYSNMKVERMFGQLHIVKSKLQSTMNSDTAKVVIPVKSLALPFKSELLPLRNTEDTVNSSIQIILTQFP
jgi:hypothetical protein